MTYRFALPALVAATTFATATSAAFAADLDPAYADIPPPVAQQQVTFGSGWYVRGDISGNDMPTLGVSKPQLGNVPTMNFDGAKKLGYAGSLGGGYSFTNGFRADAVFDYRKPLASYRSGATFPCQNGYGLTPGSTTQTQIGVDPITGLPLYQTTTTPAKSYATYGACNGNFNASLNSYDALVNIYYDVGTWYGVTPYVGAGVGLSFGHYHTAANYVQSDGSSYDLSLKEPVSGSTYRFYYDKDTTGDYYNLAWALMAGFSYDITNHAKLDIGYRYVNLGKVLGTQYTVQEARAGLRYMIDN